jgi:hypothetical protein
MDRHASPRDPSFRFSRMGPSGKDHQLDPSVLKSIAKTLTRGGSSADEESGVPAGYTYLGQFVAHDLSFDKTVAGLGDDVAPERLVQERSPSLDLDSLYGAGPQDRRSRTFYAEDGRSLETGTTAADSFPEFEGFDLPRTIGPAAPLALIPDPRNDDNLAVAQTHAAFIRFHNRVAEAATAAGDPAADRFAAARELVTRHYQWMVWHDYLPRICEPTVLDDVRANGRKVFEAGAEQRDAPSMPIEFSVGSFRLGHSMVRDIYKWNRRREIGPKDLFVFSARGGNLGGGRALPSIMAPDLRRFYDFGAAGRPDLAVTAEEFNVAKRIDTRIVTALGRLPLGTFGATAPPADNMETNLAFRNLMRARQVELASGQQMFSRLAEHGVHVRPLSREQIWSGMGGVRLDAEAIKDAVAKRTPLWIYILREAELNHNKLDGVGARIVAETFHRAIAASRISIFRDPPWLPTLGRVAGHFTMVDLLLFASSGELRQLAPIEQ